MLSDAQTSGGLLISVEAEAAADFLHRLHEAGVRAAVTIGQVTEGDVGHVEVTSDVT